MVWEDVWLGSHLRVEAPDKEVDACLTLAEILV